MHLSPRLARWLLVPAMLLLGMVAGPINADAASDDTPTQVEATD